jgi:hypothetical protein
MLSLGCLPLWGREGVTLIAAAEDYRMTLKKRVAIEPIVLLITALKHAGGVVRFWGRGIYRIQDTGHQSSCCNPLNT